MKSGRHSSSKAQPRLFDRGGAAVSLTPDVADALHLEEFGLSDNDDDDDDEDSYDEQQELATLVAASVKQTRQAQTQSPAQASFQARVRNQGVGGHHPGATLIRRLFGSRKSLRLMAVIAMVFLAFYVLSPSSTKGSKRGGGGSGSDLAKVVKGVEFSCPKQVKNNPNLANEKDVPVVDDDLKVWLNTFRQRDVDHWGHTYNQVKESMADWKSSRFAPYLRRNSSIYNVHAGVGLDALMTLELLREENGLWGMTVYGNDMRQDHVDTMQHALPKLLGQAHGRFGRVCRADSTRLRDFVPENSFDLVFCSRIPPLVNPLQLPGDAAAVERQYSALCSSSSSHSPSQAAQLQQMQAKQDQWYALLVQEMLRVAKPNAPVIVEHVSLPLCQNLFDFGGVSRAFWNATTASFRPQIRPSTLHLEPDKLAPQQRYHVFVRKKRQKTAL